MSQLNGITVEKIQSRLPRAVLLYIQKGNKGPTHKDWDQTTFAATQYPTYQSALRRFANTGVLLGVPSDNLIAIDFDCDDDIEPFLDANPLFKETLRTRGQNGCQFWARIVGQYPQRVVAVKDRGEWRGAQNSVLRGIHPSGCHYTWLVDADPIQIAFQDIVLPSWLADAIENKQSKSQPEPPKSDPGNSPVVKFCKEHTLEVCEKYLTNGCKDGDEWRLGDLDGNAGKSAGIALDGENAGAAYDFNGQQSAFVLEVIARALGIDTAEAAVRIEQDFNLRPERKSNGTELKQVTAYYDIARKEYLLQNTAGRWHSYDISQFKLQLRGPWLFCKACRRPGISG